MKFRVLGPLRAVDDDGSVVTVTGQQGRLLAGLLISADEVVSSDRLVDLLWSRDRPSSARASLHSHVSRLRRRFGLAGGPGAVPLLETGPAGYRLRIDETHLDAGRFEHMVAVAAETLPADPASAAVQLDSAVEMWDGRAYAQFADEPFALAEVARLEELRSVALEHRFEARLRCGQHADIVAELERFVVENPFRERACGQLMLALCRCARQVDALDVYRRLRERLASELGLEPSADLQRLEGDILRQDASLEWLRVGGDDGRLLRHAVRGTVQMTPTSFVGREDDLAALVEILGRRRLVTLTGVGGVGKSRLAQTVAASVAESYDDGAWLCELDPVVDGSAVPDAIATALGLARRTGGYVEDSLLAALHSRRMLLVLDNCEHVIDAVRRLAEGISGTCLGVTVLATSRQRLAVAGEQCWPVEPLPVDGAHPDRTDPSGRAPAVQLFFDRVTSIDPRTGDLDPVVVTDICRRLDGVPLGIELAAARVSALGVDEVHERLGDRLHLLATAQRGEGRHRTLGAVVDWSYDLLREPERILFARLSVFAGTFDLEAAERVCADGGIGRPEVAGLVAELIEASLVVREDQGGTPRLRLLETLRQYAAERLSEREEQDAVRTRFAEHFLGLAEGAEPLIRGVDEAHWVVVLDQELDNLRATFQQATSRRDVDHALRLVSALHYYAHFRLRDEITGWAGAALVLPGSERHPQHAEVIATAAEGAGNRGDLDRAVELAEIGLQDPQGAGPAGRRGRIRIHETLAALALYQGRLAVCSAHAQQALDLAIPAGEPFHSAFALLHQVLAHLYDGNRAAALELSAAQQEAADRSANPTQQAWAAYAAGEALAGDDVHAALRCFDDAITTAEGVGNAFTEGVARVAVCALNSRHGNADRALLGFREVISHWHRRNDWTHQRTTIRALVEMLVRLDRDEQAAVLYGATLHAGSGAVAFGADRARLAATEATLTRRLGAEQFDEAVERGAALSDDEVVQVACRDIDEALSRVASPVR